MTYLTARCHIYSKYIIVRNRQDNSGSKTILQIKMDLNINVIKFWSVIENDLAINVPCYIKNAMQ